LLFSGNTMLLMVHAVSSLTNFPCHDCERHGYARDTCACGWCGSFGFCSFTCTSYQARTQPRASCEALAINCSAAPQDCSHCGKYAHCFRGGYSIFCNLMPAECLSSACLPFRLCLAPPEPPGLPPAPPSPPNPPSPPPSPPSLPLAPCDACSQRGLKPDLCQCGMCGSIAACDVSCDPDRHGGKYKYNQCLPTPVNCSTRAHECIECDNWRDCLAAESHVCPEMPPRCRDECLPFRHCVAPPPSASPRPLSPPPPPPKAPLRHPSAFSCPKGSSCSACSCDCHDTSTSSTHAHLPLGIEHPFCYDWPGCYDLQANVPVLLKRCAPDESACCNTLAQSIPSVYFHDRFCYSTAGCWRLPERDSDPQAAERWPTNSTPHLIGSCCRPDGPGVELSIWRSVAVTLIVFIGAAVSARLVPRSANGLPGLHFRRLMRAQVTGPPRGSQLTSQLLGSVQEQLTSTESAETPGGHVAAQPQPPTAVHCGGSEGA